MAKALDIIKVIDPKLSLRLNIKKTELFWTSCEGLFLVGIGKPPLGVRTCQPVHMEKMTLFFDNGLCGVIEDTPP